MFIAVLARILLLVGAIFLATLVVKIVLLTLRDVLLRIKEKLRVTAGRRCFVGSVSKLAREITMEAERTGNIHRVDDLLAELGEDGIVIASVDANNEVNPDEIEVLSSKKMDEGLEKLLQKNQGEIIFA